jgi:PAT family beta-lactamase induction signal transducer AmpG
MLSKLSFLRNPRIFAMLFVGFASGLPLALTSSTLQAWFTQAGVSIVAIGALTLVGLPYNLKFLWAPVMDRFVPPLLGRRRGWICLMQLGLCVSLFIFANMNPGNTPMAMGLLALLIAFLSASQDVAIDAYRTDVLLPDERGVGSATFIFAFRMAMLISGGLALIAADYIGWRLTYEMMAVFLGLLVIAMFFMAETPRNIQPPKDFFEAVVEPFKDLLQRDAIGIILLFIVFYKFGDAIALSLMSNFLLHGLGFSLTDVGVAFKIFGLLATILGAFAGGLLMKRLGLFRAMFTFGLAQAFSNLMFMLLAMIGKNYFMLFSSIFIEQFCSGMTAAVFMVFLMSLCHQKYSATQYACLSAIFALGRVLIGPVAAVMVEHIGWVSFFGWSFILSFPGIILLSLLYSKVQFNAEVVEI